MSINFSAVKSMNPECKTSGENGWMDELMQGWSHAKQFIKQSIDFILILLFSLRFSHSCNKGL